MVTRSVFASLLLVMILLPLSAVAALTSDPSLRECMRVATNNRETRLIDATRNYHINWFNIISDRRQRYIDSWNVESDKDRQRIQRDIDKFIRDLLKQNDGNYRNDQKGITNDFKNDERACKDQFKARQGEVPKGAICFSSDECRAPLGMCSTETGECRAACQPGSNPCIQVCSGRCKLR